MERRLRQLLEAKPELAAPDVLQAAGFPPRAIALFVSQLDGVGCEAVSRALAAKLDRRAFDELCAALALLVVPGAPSLSLDGVGGLLDEGSPWWAATMAVLGAPAVTLRASAQMTASWVGMQPLVDMWKRAQKQRRTSTQEPPTSAPGSGRGLHTDRQVQPASTTAAVGDEASAGMSAEALVHVTAALSQLNLHQYVVMAELDNGDAYVPIRSVLGIEWAVYEEERFVNGSWVQLAKLDCTRHAGGLLEVLPTKDSAGESHAAPAVYLLHLHGSRIDELLRALGVTPRRPSAAHQPYRFGDITRRAMRSLDGMMEQAIEGGTKRLLRIQFRKSAAGAPAPAPEEYLPCVEALVAALDAHGQLRSLHRDDGEFTWFKLNEWMQVEIMEAFGASLSHASWYRFPYMEMLSMYFHTLLTEVAIVEEKHGFSKAWLSSAAAFDFVPGALMALYFGQLWLLGMPLRAVWGSGTTFDDYAKTYSGDRAPVEELLVRTGPQPPDWRATKHVLEVRRLLPELYAIIVPTFKTLTLALQWLAEQPDVAVLRISNQAQVQLRVQLPHPERQLAALRKRHGVQVMFEYSFPVDGTGQPPPKLASLCVDVPYLLDVIRFSWREQIKVMQVYDFWC